ncbi:MAG: glycosyltransferase [Anaerolineales bacterium]|nr:glycosyltransferase [Anaerolineales bacterium]
MSNPVIRIWCCDLWIGLDVEHAYARILSTAICGIDYLRLSMGLNLHVGYATRPLEWTVRRDMPEAPPTRTNDVLVLIPAWNEAAHISAIVEAAAEFLPVLVVDDGSVDETPQLSAIAGATVIRHEENLGKGRALVTGFQWGVKEGYNAIISLDADGQHDPVEIPNFLTAYESHAGDLIIGRRDFRQMPFPNAWANPIGSFLLSLALGQRIYDNQSGYRLYTRRLLEALDLQSSGFELEVEVIAQAITKGFRIGWVKIRTIYGTGKKSYFHPWHDSIRFFKMVGYAYRSRRGNGKE